MNDLINGLFEFCGAALLWKNVLQIMKDRRVRGVDWRVTGFFSVWGLWNVYYYPSLGQWWSTVGGIVMLVANTAWVVLAWRWRER